MSNIKDMLIEAMDWNEFDVKEVGTAPKWSENIDVNINGLYELLK